MNPKNSGIIYVAVLGAVVATFCDKMHVLTGALYYPQPFINDQAWWVFPGFTVAFTAMGIVYLQMVKFLPANISRVFSTSPTGLKSMSESMLMFALFYILSGFGNESPLFLNLLFYGTFLIRLTLTQDKIFILILSVILGIGGTLGEGILSWFGLVYYTKPVIFLVPTWLGGLYFHGAFALRDSMRLFVYRNK